MRNSFSIEKELIWDTSPVSKKKDRIILFEGTSLVVPETRNCAYCASMDFEPSRKKYNYVTLEKAGIAFNLEKELARPNEQQTHPLVSENLCFVIWQAMHKVFGKFESQIPSEEYKAYPNYERLWQGNLWEAKLNINFATESPFRSEIVWMLPQELPEIIQSVTVFLVLNKGIRENGDTSKW